MKIYVVQHWISNTSFGVFRVCDSLEVAMKECQKDGDYEDYSDECYEEDWIEKRDAGLKYWIKRWIFKNDYEEYLRYVITEHVLMTKDKN